MNEIKLAEKLTELRMAKGVTQDEIAVALSVSAKTISKWERGASAPDLSSLAALSQYYRVSTDALLGLEAAESGTEQVLANEFRGLDRRDTALKVFEIIKATFPATYAAAQTGNDANCDDRDVIPPKTDELSRYRISLPELFHFAVCSDDVNLAVIQLRNKSNFSWLSDENKQKRILKLLGFLADADVMKILAFMHSTACSESFTAAYIAKRAAVAIDKTTEVLEACTEIGVCTRVTAHLKTGEMAVYESSGDGLLLSLLSIAYERMCGKQEYNYNFNGKCKMIGGETV